MRRGSQDGKTLSVIVIGVLFQILSGLGLQGVRSAMVTSYHNNEPTLKFRLQPQKMDIVLVGDQSSIKIQTVHHRQTFYVTARPRDKGIVKVLTKELHLNSSTHSQHGAQDRIKLLGIKPGRTYMDFYLHHSNRSLMAALSRDFEVIVVERVNVLTDAFIYVLLISQVMTSLMLALRMRGAAVREVVCRPCALMSALLCQIIVMPLVAIGLSVALGLPIHTVVCLLILGCCPTGMIAPMMTVIQQAHVELALLHTLIITTAAFGVTPFWLFAYGNFLGLAYDHVSGPYLYICGALSLVAGPVIVGLLIQRFGPSSLPRLDRAIPPTCLLLMLMEFTVDAVAFCGIWNLTTWRLLAGTALLPVLGGVLGAITSATFRQKLPQTKTVTIVTCVQNTTLAKVIIQMSYPVSDASVMAVSLICVEFFTVCYMMMAYIPHVSLTLCWPTYRPLHQHAGIGGLQDSIGDRIVRSMVKAGEITFGKLQQSPAFRRVLGHDTESHDSDVHESSLSFIKGHQFYNRNSMESASYRRQAVPFSLPHFNYSQLWPPRANDHHLHQWNAKLGVCACSTGMSTTSRSTTPSGYPLKYFTDSSPDLPKMQKLRSAGDSLESLDYEMLSDCPLPSISSRVRNMDSPAPRKHPAFLNPLPPPPTISLPPTPPYMPRALTSPPDDVTELVGRARCTSTTSAGSDSTHATTASSRTGETLNVDDLQLDFQDSVSTILTHYETTLPPDTLSQGTASTRWRWDVSGGVKTGPTQHSPPPPPPASGHSRLPSKDLASIEEEERCSHASHHSNNSPFPQTTSLILTTQPQAALESTSS